MAVKYLILGNSSAACAAVDAIRENDPDGSITMCSPEPYNAYGTPLVSYVVKGTSTLETAYIRKEEWYQRHNITRLFGPGKAGVKLDAAAHVVTLEDGTQIEYEKCLVATGSVPFTPPFKGLPENALNRFTFLTMDKALGVNAYIAKLKEEKGADYPVKAVVIGGGLIGGKAAEGLAYRCDSVTVLEFAPRMLQAVLDEKGSAMLQDKWREHGVTPMPGYTTELIYTNNDGTLVTGCNLVQVKYGDDGKPYTEQVGSLECDILITAVGVRPNSAILVEAGAEQGRGIICDKHMATSLPDVYAAGDLTSVHNTLTGGEAPLALWPNANAQGRVAGCAMSGDMEHTYNGSFAINAVGFFDDVSILSCGVNPRDNEMDQYEVKLYVDEEKCQYVRFVCKDDLLYGYILMNRPDGAGIYSQVIRERIPLSELPADVFERPIQELDLPMYFRKRNMRKGFDGGEA
ncbi:MAG: NAD(P)/FAD-dependent oxidoreductase [Coriobacteriales bacterium]